MRKTIIYVLGLIIGAAGIVGFSGNYAVDDAASLLGIVVLSSMILRRYEKASKESPEKEARFSKIVKAAGFSCLPVGGAVIALGLAALDNFEAGQQFLLHGPGLIKAEFFIGQVLVGFGFASLLVAFEIRTRKMNGEV